MKRNAAATDVNLRRGTSTLGAVVTDVANWKRAELRPPPEGRVEAARRDLRPVDDRMECALVDVDWVGPDGQRDTEWGRGDLALVQARWLNRESQDVVTWGTHRLEWFMANGFHERFPEEVRADRVLWSVGPRYNALNSPLAPAPT